jgi:archaellum component FlaC
MQKTTGSGSKPLYVNASDSKKQDSDSTVNVSDLEDQMKSLSDIVGDFKRSYETAGEKTAQQAENLKRVAVNVKNLINTFDNLANSIGKKSRAEEEEGLESQAGHLIESINDLKYNFRTMEDRFISLSKEAADVPASSTPQTEA